MHQTTKQKKAIGEFSPIHLDSLRLNKVLDFDLYLKKGDEYILYRSAELPFTDKNRSVLLNNNVHRLYISSAKIYQYQRYIEANIKEIVEDDSIKESTKAGIVYDSAKYIVSETLSNPALGENIRRSQSMVESTVSYILRGQKAFYNLLRVMSFNYYTYTHSINVCTFALALARFIGIDSIAELNILGTGALLHDVGKTKISSDILNKIDPLTHNEIQLIRKHPRWGFEIIKQTDIIHPKSYFPIIEHHERENGTGYPNKLVSDKIHFHSKIVAIADVFDAMTTERVYRSAIAPYPALKTMFEDKGAFHHELLEQFTRLMGPSNLAGL
jgi:putative nucleotidyltransferase with HDIG domain